MGSVNFFKEFTENIYCCSWLNVCSKLIIKKIEEKYLKNHFKSKDTRTFEIIAGHKLMYLRNK